MKSYKSKKVWQVQRYISLKSCINYDEKKEYETKNDFMGGMVELKWWGKFETLIQNDGEFIEATEWCEENCEGLICGNWYNGLFEFELETDAMAFVLRWL